MDDEEFINDVFDDDGYIVEDKEYGSLLRNDDETILITSLDDKLASPSSILYPLFEEYYDHVIYLVDEDKKVDKIKKVIEDPVFLKTIEEDKRVYYNNGNLLSLEEDVLLLEKTKDMFIHQWCKKDGIYYLETVDGYTIKEFSTKENCNNLNNSDMEFYYRIGDDEKFNVYSTSKNTIVDDFETVEELKKEYQILRQPIFPEFINIYEFDYSIYTGKDKVYETHIMNPYF